MAIGTTERGALTHPDVHRLDDVNRDVVNVYVNEYAHVGLATRLGFPRLKSSNNPALVSPSPVPHPNNATANAPCTHQR